MIEPIRRYGLAIVVIIAVPLFFVVVSVSLKYSDWTSLLVFAGTTYLSLAFCLFYGHTRYTRHLAVHAAQGRALKSLDRLQSIYKRKATHYRKLSGRYKERAAHAISEADRVKENQDQELGNLAHELTEYINALTNSADLQEACALESINGLYSLLGKPHSAEEHHTLVAANSGLRQIISIHDRIVIPSIDAVVNILAQVIDNAGAKTNNREIILAAHTFRVSEELEASIKPYFNKAKSKGITLSLDGALPASIDVYAIGDIFRIRQVVESLVDNAIRYTSRGGVGVTLSVHPSINDCEVVVTVQDTGCGMTDTQSQRIRGIVNTGIKSATDLGTSLNIAHRVTAKMGGRLSLLSSAPGTGSIFQFRVTLPKATRPTPKPTTKAPVVSNLSLLYVDDSLVSRATFRRVCASSAIELHEAKDGKDGWEKYLNNEYSVLVIDLYMPISDGFELVEKIRAHEAENGLEPKLIYALTASPTKKNKEHALRSGFNEFIAKPYSKDVVSQIITRFTGVEHDVA